MWWPLRLGLALLATLSSLNDALGRLLEGERHVEREAQVTASMCHQIYELSHQPQPAPVDHKHLNEPGQNREEWTACPYRKHQTVSKSMTVIWTTKLAAVSVPLGWLWPTPFAYPLWQLDLPSCCSPTWCDFWLLLGYIVPIVWNGCLPFSFSELHVLSSRPRCLSEFSWSPWYTSL